MARTRYTRVQNAAAGIKDPAQQTPPRKGFVVAVAVAHTEVLAAVVAHMGVLAAVAARMEVVVVPAHNAVLALHTDLVVGLPAPPHSSYKNVDLRRQGYRNLGRYARDSVP